MIVHLIDGTYELFRSFFGFRKSKRPDDGYGAVRGVVHTALQMIETGGTHVGVATDHIIESFRNRLWRGYKTGAGIEPTLWAQFHPLEDALAAFGFAVWPMIELEADDALASAAAIAARDARVDKVCIWTPDKDLAQCVVDDRVVQVDRRAKTVRDAAATIAKYGVPPASIPDYLAVVGDAADGYPGIPGWGAKSAAAILSRYGHLENIPLAESDAAGGTFVRGQLAYNLRTNWDLALLFRNLATLRTDAPLFASVDELQWRGPLPEAGALAEKMGALDLFRRAEKLAAELAEARRGA